MWSYKGLVELHDILDTLILVVSYHSKVAVMNERSGLSPRSCVEYRNRLPFLIYGPKYVKSSIFLKTTRPRLCCMGKVNTFTTTKDTINIFANF